MHSIEIDFDVFKGLTMLRKSEDVTYNDVLRDLLKLGPASKEKLAAAGPSGAGWWVKGVLFPNGTDFRARYKGKVYTGRVQGARLVVNGISYDSPTAAARSITGTPVNGWVFWQAKLPGRPDWQVIASFRN